MKKKATFYPISNREMKTASTLKVYNTSSIPGSAWARTFLNTAQKSLIYPLSLITIKKSERASFQQKITHDFNQMKMNNLNHPKVKLAYTALAKTILIQYSRIPVNIYAWANPIQDSNGSIRWETITTEPYQGSADMINDVENNKRIVFYTTAAAFGPKDVDYSTHPLLKKTEFYSNWQQVVDEYGNPIYENGNPKMAHYQLCINDALRVIHDFIAHATTGAQFGTTGEEKAWAAHTATILNEYGFTRKEKFMAIWALTSEVRGQNSWVNFSGVNDKAFHVLSEARKLKQSGDLEGYNRLKSTISIQFPDQKTDLLPAENMLGGMQQVDDFIRTFAAQNNIPINEEDANLIRPLDYNVVTKNTISPFASSKQNKTSSKIIYLPGRKINLKRA